jgi:chromosome segregation ATPase
VKHDRSLPEPPCLDTPEQQRIWFERQLAEAQATIRTLMRQIEKEQSRYNEVARAYKKTVENIVEISRQNAELERERDIWQSRAATNQPNATLGISQFALTADEISAIRRAMARLHHPDTGGDATRMQLWNAALDALEP